MCDHYDSYYRETPEEARASKLAAEKEAARVAAFQKARKERLIRAFGKKFGYKYEAAEQLINEWEFLNNWRG